MSNIVIQRIHSLWSKHSRGGDAARVRNAVPSALSLPDTAFDSPCVLHHAEFAESHGFTQTDRIQTARVFPELRLRDIELLAESNALTVRFVRDAFNAASPRSRHTTDVFTLIESHWGRLTYNGRYVGMDSGNWWYEKSVYNIGWLTTTDRDVFLSTPPSCDYSELAHLR